MGITAIELMPLSAFPGAHNWGYDGVLPYAPVEAYGTPDDLKALIDAAHGHGLMVLLDVVYNHFGPDGNYLHSYAAPFFNEDKPTPWGAAIDFRKPPVQRYFLDNALMWLHEYGFDGLRLDAVHAISPNAFLDTLRETIETSLPAGRHVHLVLENEANQASQLQRGYTAQWDDDFHNALHVLLTGEEEGYYAAFADKPTEHLARVLGEGFAYQGEPDPRGHVRGEPSGALPPHKFVVFAQNHDQIGNRARGERLSVLVLPQRLRAALALTALTPMIPLFSWASRGAPSSRFCSLPTLARRWTRRCARDAGASSRTSLRSPTQPNAPPFPTRTAIPHSRHRVRRSPTQRMATVRSGRPGSRHCWTCVANGWCLAWRKRAPCVPASLPMVR